MSTASQVDVDGGTLDPFTSRIEELGKGPLRARSLDTLQVNLGRLCNQACKHCHVDAGPKWDGPEHNLSAELADLVLEVLALGEFRHFDLTGGAPELNPEFRRLVRGARELGIHVMDRCNLSVLFEPGQEDSAEFLAEQGVEIIASLPYYTAQRTNAQRGGGVFDLSIRGLQRLNALGYGMPDSDLVLDLVYNPGGSYLPGPQQELERDFKRKLLEEHGVHFHRLFALTNVPIRRFLDYLQRSGNEERYRQKLESAFNPAAAQDVMCRDMLSVGPDGKLYDCDFNQQLGQELGCRQRTLADLRNDLSRSKLRSREIVTGRHCFACTAGQGSSCGGAVSSS